ncbi:MAG: DUF86 domain-containing protein [Gammaproteobacteria bacterium]|nr:DUF86 domain-containing protein [Gammaproteobacteria bacterium]
MQPEERDAAYLWDMLQAAQDVLDMMGGRDLAAFLKDRVLIRAIERGVEIIGEAARRVPASFTEAHPEVPWRSIFNASHPHSVGILEIDVKAKYSDKLRDRLNGYIDTITQA